MRPYERLYLRRRAALVEHLRNRGISDEAVLAAVGKVAREYFVEPALRGRAYKDEALPIGLKQTISQPYTVAFQTMLLEIQPGDRVLEIGTGSGYQSAILSEMGVRVFSVERHRALHVRARDRLSNLGYRVVTRHGDGTVGWTACAPFDGIVVTAGAAQVPDSLIQQLRVPEGNRRGGRLVIPVGAHGDQIMCRYECTAPGTLQKERFHSFRFVPLISN